MKRLFFLCLLANSVVQLMVAQPASNITPYYVRNDFQLASPGALKFGLYGYDNPALLSYVREFDMLLAWSDNNSRVFDFYRWGLFAAAPNVGVGVTREKVLSDYVTNYSIALGTGNRSFSGGMTYNFTTATNPFLDQSDLLTLGTLIRPMPLISVAAHLTSAVNVKGWEAVGEVGVRPFGNETITAFGDYVVHRTPQLHKEYWSVGAAVEVLSGIRLTGRYFDNNAFNIGFQFSLGKASVETQSHYTVNGKYAYNTYGIRVGAYDRTIIYTIIPSKPKYVSMDMNGIIGYQRYMLFDNTKTLSDVLTFIEAAKNDPSVSGIALNTSGMIADREKLWEIREKLKEFKSTGKKVIMFIDRGGIDVYHFASVANTIVMDPFGTITLEGYLMGNTYLKGTLEKIGVGFDEWRFFKYKSANEALSREKMSDADREQRQAIVDAWYAIAKNDICESRKLTPAQFDSLVNTKVMFLAAEAKELGLIDSIGRWNMVKDIVKAETGKENGFTSANALAAFQEPYDARWSEPPKIAVIYALGACAMDEGIKARSLVNVVEDAVNNPHIKAIVLRVDSPGGDAVASDYIAEAMKKAKGKKPIIVSQGFVAASGGYWLSMYADTIIAAPGTITGSIGVIGGWLYNKNLKETLGMSTDFVKAGDHADLGFGFRLPVIGIGFPDRNLTADERARMETSIKSLYRDFVTNVAAGRKMSYEQIDSIAQGRVWSGIDGKRNGLVDILGGLETAITVAKERAGIPKDQNVTLVEMPRKGLFDFSVLMPKLFGVEQKMMNDPTLDVIKFRLERNGQPLLMLPLEDVLMMPRE